MMILNNEYYNNIWNKWIIKLIMYKLIKWMNIIVKYEWNNIKWYWININNKL